MIQINNKLRDKCYQIACAHGFHDKEYSNEHFLMLIITEISEAVEADRKGKHADIDAWELSDKDYSDCYNFNFEHILKDTVEDELADIVIRCLDFCGIIKSDLSQAERDINYNTHQMAYIDCFRCRTIPEIMLNIVREITMLNRPIGVQIQVVITKIFCLAKVMNVDLLWHIEQKMKYNELRPMFNGKKY